ncbi:barstar family protein [Pseudonocardia sp. GCM10023141]|uniref:barstar family protein n=1 Tax=Pseudonocardia sp. GCM10023141 TaxID=3252653 RepID=UPI00361090C5
MLEPLLPGDEPHLLTEAALTTLLTAARAHGVRVGRISIGAAANDVDIFDALRTVFTFPDYCGSGWDSFDDASDDIAEDTEFPLLMVVDGAFPLLARDPHRALHFLLNAADEARRWTAEGFTWTLAVATERDLEAPRRHLPDAPRPADPSPWSGLLPRGGEPFMVASAPRIPGALTVDLERIRSAADIDAVIDAIAAAPPANGVVVADGLQRVLRREPALAAQIVLALDVSYRHGFLVLYPGSGNEWTRR